MCLILRSVSQSGRLLPAILFFVFTAILWVFLLGWVIHLWACLDAALWKPRS